MTGKEFLNGVANGEVDMLEAVLTLLRDTSTDYCVIGGLAVNAYADPVVSLDLDLVVVSDRIADLTVAARAAGMKVEEFEHSVNFSITGSDLRVQLQKDPRYQDFLAGAVSQLRKWQSPSPAAVDWGANRFGRSCRVSTETAFCPAPPGGEAAQRRPSSAVVRRGPNGHRPRCPGTGGLPADRSAPRWWTAGLGDCHLHTFPNARRGGIDRVRKV